METKKCTSCGKELPITAFRKGKANGVEFLTNICSECISKKQSDGWKRKKEQTAKAKLDLVEDAKKQRLSEFTPRELMEELKRRGYVGTLEYVEVHKINLENL